MPISEIEEEDQAWDEVEDDFDDGLPFYSFDEDDLEDAGCLDEPCYNCGSYAHAADECKACEDCKRIRCTGDDACEEICRRRHAAA